MTFRRAVVSTHRWIGVAAAALWILQAATGLICVFHWEIDDAFVSGGRRPTSFAAIERQLRNIADVQSMWSTAGAPDRYDVFTKRGVLRIDGEGNVLRVRAGDERWKHGAWIDTLVVVHQSLAAGERGRWIIGTSGFFLLTNVILGIIAAWPGRGQWRRALVPPKSAPRIATLYGWHRSLGLWLAVPAVCIVSAGILLAFEVEVGDARPHVPAGALNVGLRTAIDTAIHRFPNAVVSGVGFPSADDPLWSITLKQPGEHQRAYGKTHVFISATDGHIAGDIDALRVSPLHRASDLLFPSHTGEVAGPIGRLIVFATAAWLLTMIYLGLALFAARRLRRR